MKTSAAPPTDLLPERNKYAFEIAYDGGHFAGWQAQSNGRGVQDAIERALRELGEGGTRVAGAGRTDAGVHARAQVASAALRKDWEPDRLLLALNFKLRPYISIMKAERVSQDFHARRSARSREYRYFIWNAPSVYPHIAPYVYTLPIRGMDWARAAEAAKLMTGAHDFRAFCRKSDCPDKTERTVIKSRLVKKGNLVVYRVEANAFLTNMVRIMTSNLLEIAKGKRDEAWLAGLLSGEDRTRSAQTIPPEGLFLWRVTY
ncbi:tRNA pseudouridine synthase A [Synergistales bacterium]|nr:tRNA pseudouridine synthase A [Synergistales bacterium]